jgi:hypothetical protein
LLEDANHVAMIAASTAAPAYASTAAAQQVCSMDERITGSNLPSHDTRECYKHTLKQLQARFATLVGQQKERG